MGSFIAAYTADSIDEIGAEVGAALASNTFEKVPFLEGIGIVGRVATQACFTYVAVLLCQRTTEYYLVHGHSMEATEKSKLRKSLFKKSSKELNSLLHVT